MARQELLDTLSTDTAYCDCPLVINSLLFQLLTADPESAGERKEMLPEEKAKSTDLMTLWDFEGVLKYSPIFYGYYTNRDGTRNGYRLPFAYFMTGLAVYIYSFVATLKRYGLYWPEQCMLASAVYTGQYIVYWPIWCALPLLICVCILTGTPLFGNTGPAHYPLVS